MMRYVISLRSQCAEQQDVRWIVPYFIWQNIVIHNLYQEDCVTRRGFARRDFTRRDFEPRRDFVPRREFDIVGILRGGNLFPEGILKLHDRIIVLFYPLDVTSSIFKSSRGPKFDGDAKQTLEIRVKRKVALKSLRLQRGEEKKKKKVLAAAGNRTRDQHFFRLELDI